MIGAVFSGVPYGDTLINIGPGVTVGLGSMVVRRPSSNGTPRTGRCNLWSLSSGM